MFSDEVLRDMVGSGEVVAEIEREWEQLIKDRNCLRQIFPNGNSKVGTVTILCTVPVPTFYKLRVPVPMFDKLRFPVPAPFLDHKKHSFQTKIEKKFAFLHSR
jgi:hypothetical protein